MRQCWIVVKGDNLIWNVNDRDKAVVLYNTLLEQYNESGGRPSKKPSIWQLVMEPEK